MARTKTSLSERLCRAARDGDAEKVLRLINEGADVNRKNNWGTPLHLASELGHVEVVKVLLEKGADVNAKDDYGKTPLHDASYYGEEEAVRLLLEKGADANAVNSDGKTALDLAKKYGRDSIVKLLTSSKQSLVDNRGEVSGNGHTDGTTTQPDQVAVVESNTSSPVVASHVEVGKWLSKFLPKDDAAKYLQDLIIKGFDTMDIVKEVLEEQDLGFMKIGHKRMTMKKLAVLQQE